MNECSEAKTTQKPIQFLLAISIIGLFVLFIMAENNTPKTYIIADLSDDFYGQTVAITGEVLNSKTTKDGHTFLNVTDKTATVTVVIFKSSGITIPPKGAYIEAVGAFEKYKDKPEIVAKKVVVK